MKMDFILSETDNGAMKEALSLLAKIAPYSRENYIVVVPETKTLFAERFLLDKIKNHAFTNIYIYSFNRLLKKIQTVKKLPLSKQCIVAAINQRKDAAEIWNRVYDELVQPCVRMIHEKKDVEAYRLYKSFTLTCAAQYTCSRNDDLS